MFDGIGVELSPGKWRLSAMQGRLLEAVPFDISNHDNYNRAAFERKGYGFKTGYENNANSYSVCLFKAKDDKGSLNFIPPDASITPLENVSMAIAVRQTIWKRVFADAEYSLSALNRNTGNSKSGSDSTDLGRYNLLTKWLSPTSSTAYFDALQTGIGYTASFYTIQLRYERVAPGYVTLGAYNVVNDLRNITIAPAIQLLNGRLNLAGNAGIQDNNLDKGKSSTTRRCVGSGNISFMPDAHWMLNTSYSNFSMFTRVRPLADPYFSNPLDSLNFYQVNTTYTGTASYSFGSKEVKQSLMANVSYQKAADKQQAQATQQQISIFYTANAGYTYNQVQNGFTLTAGGNYYVQQASGMHTQFMGPTLSSSKTLIQKKLILNASATYNKTQAIANGNTSNNNVWNASIQASFTPTAEGSAVVQAGQQKRINGKHSLNAGISFLHQSAASSKPAFRELTATVGYMWSF
jgi:hypothetical protein